MKTIFICEECKVRRINERDELNLVLPSMTPCPRNEKRCYHFQPERSKREDDGK